MKIKVIFRFGYLRYVFMITKCFFFHSSLIFCSPVIIATHFCSMFGHQPFIRIKLSWRSTGGNGIHKITLWIKAKLNAKTVTISFVMHVIKAEFTIHFFHIKSVVHILGNQFVRKSIIINFGKSWWYNSRTYILVQFFCLFWPVFVPFKSKVCLLRRQMNTQR